MRGLPIAAIAISVLIPVCCNAQRYTFRYYMQPEGLNNLNVQDMVQDHEGFIWAGTQNGVFRYDGFRFEQISLAPGAATNTVDDMYVDLTGHVWVGLESTVEVFQDGKFQRVLYQGKDLPTHSRSTFSSSRDGKVFVVSNGDLFEVTQSTAVSSAAVSAWTARKVTPHDPAAHDSRLEVNSVLAQQDGSLLLGCGRRVCRFNGSRVEWWGPNQGLAEDSWDVLFRASNGDLWTRSDSRVAVLKRGESAFQSRNLPGPSVKDTFTGISEDSHGRILTFSDRKLLRWEGNTWKTFDEHQGLAPYVICALLVDRDGEIWLGSSGHGLAKWLGYGYWEHWTAAEGLQNNVVWAVVRDHSGRLWVGNANGVAFLDPGAKRFVPWHMPSVPGAPNVQSIAVSKDGAVWIAADGGHLLRVDPATRAVTRADFPARIYRILAHTSGAVWVATAAGLYRVDHTKARQPSGKIPAALSLKGWMNDVAGAPDGQIFARTDTGLLRFDGSVWHEIQLGSSLTLGGFWAELNIDKTNSIWTDGASPGLVHLQIEHDRVVHVDRLPAATVGSTETVIVANGRRGQIWVGSDAGISFLDGGKWHLLTQEQGLIWNDCDSRAFLEDDDGSVWIGTSGGLSHLLTVDPFVEPRDLKLTAVSATFGAENLLRPTPSSLTWNEVPLIIQLAAPTFHEGPGLKLRYRLLGLEQNWVETANREIRYPQLAPGSYTFEAFATDTSRVQDSGIYRLAFVIKPPWWRTRSALLLYALLSMASVVLLSHWRVQSLIARQRELEALVAERTEELDKKKAEAEAANRAKSDFLAQMSHEIRTPLNGVIGMTSILSEMSLNDDQRECVDTIHHSSDLLLTVLNDILDFSKVEAGKLDLENVPFDLKQTVKECSYLVSELVRRKGLAFELDVDAQVPNEVLGDPTRLRQILLNLLSNAIKFTAHGKVGLRVFEETRLGERLRLRFEVSDSGPGLDPNALGRLFTSFSQADASTSRKYGGTGLGLAICSSWLG